MEEMRERYGIDRKKTIDGHWETCYNRDTESQRAKAAYPLLSEGRPSRRKKGGLADVCYIPGSYPDRYLHRRPRGIVLYDLRGQKIAATTTHSDGCPLG